MDKETAPEKPPRSANAMEGGRTLWQINWNEQTEEPMVTMVDISNIELREGDEFKPQVSMDDETGDIHIFEQNAQEIEHKLKNQNSIFKRSSEDRCEIVLPNSKGPLPGQRYLVRSRSDSDLELYSPGQRRFQICSRIRWCCVSCRTLEFWRQYWWIAGVFLLSVVIYSLITWLILNTLLRW